MIEKYPDGDIWRLTDNDPDSQYYGRSFKFNFENIFSEEIKNVMKCYVYSNYITRNRTLIYLYYELVRFNWFNQYAEKSNISSFKDLTNFQISMFISFLNTSVSDTTGRKLSYAYRKKSLDALKNIVYWCQLHKPDSVPNSEIFTGGEYTGVHRELKIDFIPDEVIEQINEALKTEKNPYLRYGIIILESTGMRIGDMLRLKTDCIKPHLISGYTMTWFDHKTRKEHKPMPIRSECAEAIQKLIEMTEDLRARCGKEIDDRIFIHRISNGSNVGKIMNISYQIFSQWYKKFVKKHNILNSDGELYHLTNHQFRRTLGTDMISKGVNINVIQQVLGHSSPSVTRRFYADVKDKERAEVFDSIGIIGNINQLSSSHFENETERLWFYEHKQDQAALCDGYCTKPVVDGKICDRLLKRQKCYTCSRYITTPEYLEVHKKHLAELEMQMEQGEIYGEHYKSHFMPIIETLKIIIARLEAIQHGE